MTASRARQPRALIVSLIFVAGACSGSGSSSLLGGCSGCITPLHYPYAGPQENNAVSAEISGAGFDYINSNWQTVLGQFLDGGTAINIPISCTTDNVNIPVLGTTPVYICDQNQDQCGSPDTCNVNVQIVNFQLTPQASGGTQQGVIAGTATLAIATGDIYVDIPVTTFGVNLCNVICDVNYNSTASSAAPYNTFSVDIDFSLDGTLNPTNPVLSFNVANIQGISSINSSDLNISAVSGFCSDVCDLAQISFIENFLVQQIEPTLETQIQNIVASERCQTCTATDPLCPTGATCDSNSVCQETGGCVPRMLGIQGSIAPGTGSLGAYGIPPSATLDISAVAGGSVSSSALLPDAGGNFVLGIIGGADSAKGQPAVEYVAPCVPDLPAPTPSSGGLNVPNFDVDGAGTGFEIALGINQFFLNQAAYEAHRSGMMCLAISGEQVSLLNSGLLQTFLPSLALVNGSPSQSVTTGDVPLLVTIRPLTAPEIALGAGTYDPQTMAPIDPLITLTLNDLDIDMYALIEDRWERLFTMGVNVQLPVSLIVDGCPTQTITPAIGSLSGLITVSQAPAGSEILAEDPSVLQGLIPAVVSLAQPALAGALKPISIPSVSGFTIYVDALEGIEQNGEAYNDIGLFGSLYAGGQTPVCDTGTLRTIATVSAVHVPTLAQLHPAAGQKIVMPEVDVAVTTASPSVEAEFDYRVDDNLWTPFLRVPMLKVNDPRLLIEGHHTISVRARPASHHGAADPNPVQLDVLIDYQPPTVRLTPDSAHDTLRVDASDNVTATSALQFRYTVNGQDPGDFGAERPIDLTAINTAGGLTVDVRDQAGNIGTATYRAPTLVAGAGAVLPTTAASPPAPASTSPRAAIIAAGCSSSGTGLSLLSLLLLPWWRRRR